MGLGTVGVKHNAYVYIKPIANGVVVECGNQIVGDEAVFYSGNDEDTRRIVNAYLTVLFYDVLERPAASVKKAMLSVLENREEQIVRELLQRGENEQQR